MEENKSIPFSDVEIQSGFWLERQKLNEDATIPQVYKRFEETDRFSCISRVWERPFVHSHIFFDSDTAKWLEAAAYALHKHPGKLPELENRCDMIIDSFARLQNHRGYVNSYYQRHLLIKFSNRNNHELYCAGHLAEAAIAYYKATGKKKLLDVVDKYIDYIAERFVRRGNPFYTTPGHEEIELALFRLYEELGDEKYKKLAEFFLEKRGQNPNEYMPGFALNNYDQHNKPIRELEIAEGHAVRAVYLYSAMADMARLNKDEKLLIACKKLYKDIQTKMYVTGGIGSSYKGEAFTISYDLPNLTAYTESCACIGLTYFLRRMLLMENNVCYADDIERIMYNNMLSSTSLDGKAFFYENPLEIDLREFTKHTSIKKPDVRLPITQRKTVFNCSCCPPNIARQMASIGGFVFTQGEDTIYLHQYIGASIDRSDIKLQIQTDYPKSGKVKINIKKTEKKFLCLRIPSWCKSYALRKNGSICNLTPENGYLKLEISAGTEVILELEIKPYIVKSNPLNKYDTGKCAIMLGPVVYCLEAVDNGGSIWDLAINSSGGFSFEGSDLSPLPYLIHDGYRLKSDANYYQGDCEKVPTKVKLTPYYTFANRGESDMRVWIPLI